MRKQGSDLPSTLQAATRCAVASLGGIKVAAALLNISAARVSDYQNEGNPEKAGQYINVHQAMILDQELMAQGHDPILIQTYARLLGGTFSPTPEGLDRTDLKGQITEHVMHNAKLLAEWIPAAADNKYSAEEAAVIGPLAQQAIQNLSDLLKSLPSNDGVQNHYRPGQVVHITTGKDGV